MLRGWIKIDRDIIKRSIFNDAELLRLFIYLKADAAFEPYEQLIDGKLVALSWGQGTFGRNQLAAALNVNPSTLYKRLRKLQDLGYITITSHKEMSVYTITNREQPEDEKVTAKCQPQDLQPQDLQPFEKTESNNLWNEKEQQSNTLIECKKKNKDIPPTPYDEILKLYHSICVSLPKVRQLTDNRKRSLGARWGEHKDLETFKELFTKAEQSDFLSGRKQTDKDWKCNFDWLINQQNMIKILEGNYDGKPQQKAFKKPKLVVR